MLGSIKKLKWFVIGLVIGSLITYIFIGERLSGIKEEIKQWFSLETGGAYAEETSISTSTSAIQRPGKGKV